MGKSQSDRRSLEIKGFAGGQIIEFVRSIFEKLKA